MILALALSSALLTTAAAPPAPPQVSASAPTLIQAPQTDPEAAVDLSDVTVSGRRLEQAAQDFVQDIGAPARGRGLARWRDRICIGVVNMRRDAAQQIVDRVSEVALDLGLRPGEPGCNANTTIIAVKDADSFTRQFVEARPRLFLVGGTGMDRGPKALERFKTSGKPVRWWAVSAPVDSHTGDIAIRLPDEAPPTVTSFNASRLSTQIVDDTMRVVIVVDADKIAGISVAQLSDYLAMVVLAQIDPEADSSGYNSVLNLFGEPEQTRGLTDWDGAYLQGLYAADRTRVHQAGNRNQIVSTMVRTQQRRLHESPDEAPDDAVTPTP